MRLNAIQYSHLKLCGVEPEVTHRSMPPHFPDALFFIWRVLAISGQHHPHAVLLDEHTAVMPTTLDWGLWFAECRHKPDGLFIGLNEGDHLSDMSGNVMVLTGATAEETVRVVLTTMQLMYNLSTTVHE